MAGNGIEAGIKHGSEVAPYFVGEKAELLGLFSINLRRALDLAPQE